MLKQECNEFYFDIADSESGFHMEISDQIPLLWSYPIKDTSYDWAKKSTLIKF